MTITVYNRPDSDGKLRLVAGIVYSKSEQKQMDMMNHNPRVGGSSPSSATKNQQLSGVTEDRFTIECKPKRALDIIQVDCGWMWLHRIADEKAQRGFCYFAKRPGGFVKIGFSEDPEARMISIAQNEGIPVELSAVVRGGRAREKAYHAQFAGWRAWGEWFQAGEEILAEIDRINQSPPALTTRMEVRHG